MVIKAIQTEYKGYKFRSRLEARYAVLFDALGLDWEYETEGYELPDGTWYLPDFYIPSKNSYIEIKGTKATNEEINKCRMLAEKVGATDLIATGDTKLVWGVFNEITKMCDKLYGRPATLDEKNTALDEAILRADKLRKVYIFDDGLNGQALMCTPNDDLEAIELNKVFLICYLANTRNLKEIGNAVIAAKQARFEHGETPL